MTSIDYVPRSDPSGSSYADGVITGANGRLSPRGARGPSLHIDVTGANNRGTNGQVQSQQIRARDNHQEGGHSILEDESPDNSEDEVADGLRRRGSEDSIEMHEGEEDMDDSGSFSDSLSSSPSIPDEDIDFSLVYALHTFLATVDGQASVVKGDKLLLLDDSNSYWWLVRVLKTQAVGYIPAENIETPWERLARLNKHRNVDVRKSSLLQDVTLHTDKINLLDSLLQQLSTMWILVRILLLHKHALTVEFLLLDSPILMNLNIPLPKESSQITLTKIILAIFHRFMTDQNEASVEKRRRLFLQHQLTTNIRRTESQRMSMTSKWKMVEKGWKENKYSTMTMGRNLIYQRTILKSRNEMERELLDKLLRKLGSVDN